MDFNLFFLLCMLDLLQRNIMIYGVGGQGLNGPNCDSADYDKLPSRACPYPYQFEFGDLKGENAAIFVCNPQNESIICPSPSKLRSGYPKGEVDVCLDGICARDEKKCKLFGDSCSGKPIPGECCESRLILSDSRKTEISVGGVCNRKNKKCTPCLPSGSICDSRGELGCCTKQTKKMECLHPYVAAKTNPGPTVFNSVGNYGKTGNQTTKRCQSPDICTYGTPKVIFCGPYLPQRYNKFPFCKCPTADLLTGFQCSGTECKSCALHGGTCATQTNCCVHHNCVHGRCIQCFPHLGAAVKDRSESCEAKKFGGCCLKSDICAESDLDTAQRTNNPPVFCSTNKYA